MFVCVRKGDCVKGVCLFVFLFMSFEAWQDYLRLLCLCVEGPAVFRYHMILSFFLEVSTQGSVPYTFLFTPTRSQMFPVVSSAHSQRSSCSDLPVFADSP